MKFGIALIVAVASWHQVAGLTVSVYYESLCPDSIRFITRQLFPTYNTLQFDVEFIPYGKAAHTVQPWSIRCQHGANECLGNAVQACALERIPVNADQVNFVNCVMGSEYPPEAGKSCANKVNTNYTGVASCSTGPEGRELLARHGDKTQTLYPYFTFVPTIVLNGVFDQNIQNLALTNLAQAICQTDSSVVGCSQKRPLKVLKNKRMRSL